MATTPMSLLSERWLDEVVLFGAIINTAGADIVESFRAPAGLGDLAIMEAIVLGSAQATPVALSTFPAVRIDILSPDAATILDFVGVFLWWQEHATQVAAYVSPDPLVLWRANELLRVISPEIDTNASPTADLQIMVKAVRVRPQEPQGRPGPVRLVR